MKTDLLVQKITAHSDFAFKTKSEKDKRPVKRKQNRCYENYIVAKVHFYLKAQDSSKSCTESLDNERKFTKEDRQLPSEFS
ncbi:hypothetical protein P5673_013400 [Acropora cervicornis]|uniref:Uncharacterized protein n=1 Tax=Acropora cervicornis TaxID=6130 RepID=A0AAD9QKN4_ACRCE|nr:hypothetical protein P5673_013400 [Acropora cervicornis]